MGNRSVFVIEDDLELSTVIDRIIKNIDPRIRVEWTTTAEDAIRIILDRAREKKNQPYDLIIVDIFLEGKTNGLDLWRLCRTLYPQMPIIITSATNLDRLLTSTELKIAQPTFLRKPFSVSECRRMLRLILTPDSRSGGIMPTPFP